jgi:hypothetical protein
MKGHRRILPPHIIYKEKNNIGLFGFVFLATAQKGQCQYTEKKRVFHHL